MTKPPEKTSQSDYYEDDEYQYKIVMLEKESVPILKEIRKKQKNNLTPAQIE